MEGMNAEVGQWMYSSTEESDFIAQMLRNCTDDVHGEATSGDQPGFWLGPQRPREVSQEASSYFSVSNTLGFSRSNSYSSNNLYYSSMDNFCVGDHETNTSSYLIEGEDCNVDEITPKVVPQNLMAKLNMDIKAVDDHQNDRDNRSEIPLKRCRSSGDVIYKNKRSIRSRKSVHKEMETEDEREIKPQNSSSEDESKTSSLRSKKDILNSNGKTRACRGAATDPQSLYARKRRERINERLKNLQHLVPNGTKVDISTMLEEAVHYVKFLQLQIKLLSSDDLWMYAPIAYNGMDINTTR